MICLKKKIIYTFFIIICIGCLLFCAILSYKQITKPKEPVKTPNIEDKENTGTNKTQDEYIYKEELLNLGYTMEEINIIEEKISINKVKKYLLNEKYIELTSFIESEYFNYENLNRYQKYFDKTTYTSDIVVLYVEMGLDYDFYTNVKETDTSKKELMIVNKYNRLSSDYVPKLKTLDSKYGNGKLETNTYSAFTKMCDEAKKDNINLRSVSAYRSYSTQKSIYNNYVKRNGQTKADTFSARAGHSEHQTGLAIDINPASSNAHFENTKEYDWLINNSYKYGFILRYPLNKTHITGYKYEPWHYRYVGIEAATKIHEENITYEEYVFKFLNNFYQ